MAYYIVVRSLNREDNFMKALWILLSIVSIAFLFATALTILQIGFVAILAGQNIILVTLAGILLSTIAGIPAYLFIKQSLK